MGPTSFITADGKELPPLPRIGAGVLEKVFTHKGIFTGTYTRTATQEYVSEPLDNERLAWIGAATLQLCIGRYLYDRYPRKLPNFLTQERAFFISSTTLAEWARLYQLPEQLRAHADNISELRADRKIGAGLFTAYVGAVMEHSGMDAVQTWIDALIDADVLTQREDESEDDDDDDDEDETRRGGVNSSSTGPSPPSVSPNGNRSSPFFPPSSSTNSLSSLNERATQLRKKITWDEESHGPQHAQQWRVKLMMDGKLISEGSADKKRNAKNVAAGRALATLGWTL